MKKLWIVGILAILLLVTAGIFFYPQNKLVQQESFDLNYALIKSVIKQYESSSLDLKITSKIKDNFQLKLSGVGDLVSLTETSFDFEGSKTTRILFNGNSEPGVYVGNLFIKSNSGNRTLPVVLEIQSIEPDFVVNIDASARYKEVLKGQEILSEIKIFNIQNKDPTSVRLEYSIKDIFGNDVQTESELVNVESRIDFIKTTHLPTDLVPGEYVFSVKLKSEKSTVTSSFLFSIVEKKSGFFSGMDIFSVLVLVFILAIIVVIVYILKERNKLLLALEKQHENQLNSLSRNLEIEKERYLRKAKNDKDRTIIIKKFDSAKKKILDNIVKEQARQKKELEELKKKGSKKVIGKKMHEWKKQGYSKAVKSAGIDKSLRAKLEALDAGMAEGVISKESYAKGKQRLNKYLKK